MRDCFVANLGDFVKYGLLRAIGDSKRLGIAWYYHRSSNAYRLARYLQEPERWRHLDPDLFDALKNLVVEDRRTVAEVERSGILGNAEFHRSPLDAHVRRDWFEDLKDRLVGCDLVFADPDKGLHADMNGPSNEHILFSEAEALAEGGRTVVIYHHCNRAGTHPEQIRGWMQQLPGCRLAYYWRQEGQRVFFVLNPDRTTGDRLRGFAQNWQGDPRRPNGCLIEDAASLIGISRVCT